MLPGWKNFVTMGSIHQEGIILSIYTPIALHTPIAELQNTQSKNRTAKETFSNPQMSDISVCLSIVDRTSRKSVRYKRL